MGAISFASLSNVFRIPEIRNRLLFTLMVLAIYRVGALITVPGIPADKVDDLLKNQGGGIFDLLNMFTGGGLQAAAIFGLGIMPYITASIIMQLLTIVVPSLYKLQREGETGYIKINRITRYITVALAAMESVGFFFVIKGQSATIFGADFKTFSVPGMSRLSLVVISMTAGAVLLMWMGELITARGIGNGMSLLIFASILSGAKNGVTSWLAMPITQKLGLVVIALAMTAFVVLMQEGQRKIPVQYAKRMIGSRRMSQGGSTYLPMRVNMAGVIPIIFATALMAFPTTVASFGQIPGSTYINRWLAPGEYTYLIMEAFLVMMFTFFYSLVQFNPDDQADNLKKHGGFIPGVRPGAPTSAYLGRVLYRLTLTGSLFLAFLVILPGVLTRELGFSQNVYGALGGTTILIVVGVALDAMRQMESQLVMRNYQGFLK